MYSYCVFFLATDDVGRVLGGGETFVTLNVEISGPAETRAIRKMVREEAAPGWPPRTNILVTGVLPIPAE